jgi:hypothetical protein
MPDEQAIALEGIGLCLISEGNIDGGTTQLRHALEIYQQLSMQPDADRVRSQLSDPNDS